MKPSEQIREIWQEMKELKRMREYESDYLGRSKQRDKLENKFAEIEILFGHESTLDKAIIYYLNSITPSHK